ncbi:PRC-barrel domain-containing protein [Ancylobacter lacus]|uniref:PRC-barrel domain-containing protein n=1 Tax=Ancylobacter lacus TaxID=2579970 RepID=UPI001BCA7D0D|nr:PRC-barrel domain-containing protein [Ancylobacter lacus]MBS7541180.1 PRC-barrel domain-containing protein [Ancylobacter lacus]
MTRSAAFVAGTLVMLASAAITPAMAQGAKQTVSLTEISSLTLATGYRSSKVVGSTVYNDAKEDIGKIDDLIVTSKDGVPFAVVSVGGFLGMGKHYVVVPASSLEVVGGRITLHGATKDSLKALPDYTYTY